MSVLYCIQCGSPNDNKRKFCKDCGALLQTEAIKSAIKLEETGEKSRKKLRIGVVVVLIVAAAITAYFIWSNNYHKTPEVAITQDSTTTSNYVDEYKNLIRKRIIEYYQLADASDCNGLTEMFTPIVETYNGHNNLTAYEIQNDCSKYYSRWPYHSTQIDFSSLNIETSGSSYTAVYNLFFKTRKNLNESWKVYN